MIISNRAKNSSLILSSILLSIVLTFFLPFFFFATIVHLSFYHRYSWKESLISLGVTTISTLVIGLISGVWIVVIPFLLLNIFFTLVFLIPVKRRLYTTLILGLFSGVALIATIMFALQSDEIGLMMLENWNSLTPESMHFMDVESLRTEILYQFFQEGVSVMVKVVAFVWFASRWLGSKETRMSWLVQFRLGRKIHTLLLLGFASYLVMNLLLRWTSIDINGRILFFWSNLAPIALFLLFIEGLAVMLRWGVQHQWTVKQQERLTILLLLLSIFPHYLISMGVQMFLGIIGLAFSKRQQFMSI